MRFLSLFAGIGGFDLGLERAGHECVGQVEIDPACQRVLAERFPRTIRWGDVASLGDRSRGPEDERRAGSGNGDLSGSDVHVGSGLETLGCDLLVGGFPCQDLSVAGKRAGLKGERSGLFWEIVRIAKEIRPTWGLFENVPGLLSSHNGRDFWLVLSGLRECWPAVGYRVLDSQFFGVAQRRRRVFIVCGPGERSVAAVLFEPEGGGGDSATCEEARARVAACLRSRSHGAGVNPPGRGGEDDKDATDLVVGGAMVRRLMPTECERLQGFPDGWTDVPGTSDSTRYRQLGNAVTVNVAEWIGRRLMEFA